MNLFLARKQTRSPGIWSVAEKSLLVSSRAGQRAETERGRRAFFGSIISARNPSFLNSTNLSQEC